MADDHIIFFDLETTGLDTNMCHMIQLSAISGNRVFNCYIFPYRRIDERASRVNGFTTSRHQLYRHGNRVPTTPLTKALNSFIEYLQSFNCPVLLAAHKAIHFDALVLTRVLERFGLMQEFKAVVTGFLDTLVLIRNFHHGLKYYNMKSLVDYFLGAANNIHDAEEKTRMLQELFKKWSPDSQTVSRATCGVWCFKKPTRKRNRRPN